MISLKPEPIGFTSAEITTPDAVSANGQFALFESAAPDLVAGDTNGAPDRYHNDGGGLAFTDGHAEIKRWTDPTVLNLPTSRLSPGNPGLVELAPGQNPPRDLTFLQNASTYVK